MPGALPGMAERMQAKSTFSSVLASSDTLTSKQKYTRHLQGVIQSPASNTQADQDAHRQARVF